MAAQVELKYDDPDADGWAFDQDPHEWDNEVILQWVYHLNEDLEENYRDEFEEQEISGDNFKRSQLGNAQWCQDRLGMQQDEATAFSAAVRSRLVKWEDHCRNKGRNKEHQLVPLEHLPGPHSPIRSAVPVRPQNPDPPQPDDEKHSPLHSVSINPANTANGFGEEDPASSWMGAAQSLPPMASQSEVYRVPRLFLSALWTPTSTSNEHEEGGECVRCCESPLSEWRFVCIRPSFTTW